MLPSFPTMATGAVGVTKRLLVSLRLVEKHTHNALLVRMSQSRFMETAAQAVPASDCQPNMDITPSTTHAWRWGSTQPSTINGTVAPEKSSVPALVDRFNNVTAIACGHDHSAFIGVYSDLIRVCARYVLSWMTLW